MSYRILVVDDEESIRFTFTAFLSDAGYTVETAESLEESLQKLESEPFDAIFLDILLGRVLIVVDGRKRSEGVAHRSCDRSSRSLVGNY